MTYVDASVVMAALLAEDQAPPAAFWQEELVSSRLAEYEIHVRLHVLRAPVSVLEEAQALLGDFEWLEMTPRVLARALEPFPARASLRTLDALHIASALHLQGSGVTVRVATYDRRMRAAAQAMGLELAEI